MGEHPLGAHSEALQIEGQILGLLFRLLQQFLPHPAQGGDCPFPVFLRIDLPAAPGDDGLGLGPVDPTAALPGQSCKKGQDELRLVIQGSPHVAVVIVHVHGVVMLI